MACIAGAQPTLNAISHVHIYGIHIDLACMPQAYKLYHATVILLYCYYFAIDFLPKLQHCSTLYVQV